MLTAKYGVHGMYRDSLTIPLPQKIGPNTNASYNFQADWKPNERTNFLTVTQTRIVETLLSGKVPGVRSVAPFAEHVTVEFALSNKESSEHARACIEIVAQILNVPADTWQFKDRDSLRGILEAIHTLDEEDKDEIRRYLT